MGTQTSIEAPTARTEVVCDPGLRPGTREFLESGLRIARPLIADIESDCRPLVHVCASLRSSQVWGNYFIEGENSWERFCHEVLKTEAQFLERIEEGVRILESTGHFGPITQRQATTAALAQQLGTTQPPQPTHADAGRKGGKIAGCGRPKVDKQASDNITSLLGNGRGTSASYWAGRLRRDKPDFADALGRGEYKSVRAACIGAGLIIPPTDLELAKRAVKKLTAKDRRALLDWMAADGR